MTLKPDLLRTSRLRLSQRELMGEDVDLSGLYLALNHKDINILDAVENVTIRRTIEGASTVTVEVYDRDRILLRSGRLSSQNDIEIDGLYFRLTTVEKSGSTLTLTFEDREVAVLRTYDKPIKQSLTTSRKQITRAEFALRLIKEPKELQINYFIPQLHSIQPLQGVLPTKSTAPGDGSARSYGIPKGNALTVKGRKMDEEQRNNANKVLDTGVELVVPRKALVMAIMCVIQESTLRNLTGGDRDSVGLFQQRASMGWPASRIIPVDSEAFYKPLMQYINSHPSASYTEAIQSVQRSGFPQAYAQWRAEAERIVTAYGFVSTNTANANAQWQIEADTGDYEFYRGQPPTTKRAQWGKEDSWTCLKRLADEVNWRCFIVSGTVYFISDDALMRSAPIATLDEDSRGMLSIDGTYSEGAKSATVTINCEMGRWSAPPGSVVQLENMGPWNGRWLVNDVERSAFSKQGSITLKKKRPRLPEPANSNIDNTGSADQTWGGTPEPTDPGNRQFRTPGAYVQPVPAGYHNSILQGVHDTAGLSGFPAVDFGAIAGSPVVAVESGTVYKLSGHDPNEGPADPLMGVHGPFGWSIYIRGLSGSEYYYTHLGARSVVEGQRVTGGEVIAAVGDYAKWGGANHVHLGVHQVGTGPNIYGILNAPLVRG